MTAAPRATSSSPSLRRDADLRMVPAERTCLLFGDPSDDRLLPVTHVAAELDVGDAPTASMLAYPADRDAEQVGDICGGEQPVALHDRGRLASIPDRALMS